MDVNGKWGVLRDLFGRYQALELVKVTAETTVFIRPARYGGVKRRVYELPKVVRDTEEDARAIVAEFEARRAPYQEAVHKKAQEVAAAQAALENAEAAFWKDLPK